MTELSGIAYTLVTSPRIAESPSNVHEVTVQDALDTLSAKQDNIDVIGATPSVDNTVLVGGSGKDDLGGGTSVGITSTFDNLQWAFASDYASTESGTATSIGTNILIDSTAAFISKGIKRGAAIINYIDRSIAEVLTVDSEIQITHRPLNNGSNNDWTIGDNYTIHNIIQKKLDGGNQVAVDDSGNSISPIFPTAFTQVLLTSSSSSTSTSQSALEAGLFQGVLAIDSVNGYAGTDKNINGDVIGTRKAPSNNFVDALTIANEHGIRNLLMSRDMTIDVDLAGNFSIIGTSPLVVLTANAPANLVGCTITGITVTGEVDGLNNLTRCALVAITKVSGIIEKCWFGSTVLMSGDLYIFESYSQIAGIGFVDITIESGNLVVRDFHGSLNLSNITGGTHSIELSGGRLIIESGTSGTVYARGNPFEIINNSTGVIVVEQFDNKRINEIFERLDLDINKPITYTEDVNGNLTTITGADWTLTSTKTGLTTKVQRS